MNNFRFCVGTDIRFGKGQIAALPELLAPYGKRVLLTYGGGSIKRIGLYDQIMTLLKDFEVYELSGIDPNPRVDSVRAGAAICKEKNVDVILAAGGGSTLDCSKAIAAAACSDEDAWDLVLHPDRVKNALPLVTVLTLSATGSEMNRTGVISNMETNEKLGFSAEPLLPRASILDPEYTYSVSKWQTASGSADILSHILEVYFCRTPVFVADSICEALMKAVIRYAPVALENPSDYEARAQLMWASSLAINGLCATGKRQAWSCHSIEHELSAYYDVTHGAGLAVITPPWMRYSLNEDTLPIFKRYAVNVWGLPADGDAQELAAKSIELTAQFFESLGMPKTLGELGIDETHLEEMAAHAVAVNGLENAFVPLDEAAVLAILKSCL